MFLRDGINKMLYIIYYIFYQSQFVARYGKKAITHYTPDEGD